MRRAEDDSGAVTTAKPKPTEVAGPPVTATELTKMGVDPAIAAAYVYHTTPPPVETKKTGDGGSTGGSTTPDTRPLPPPDAVVGNAGGDLGGQFPGGIPAIPGAGTTGGGGNGAGGGSGGGGDTKPPGPALDWKAYLQNWGFDDDMIAELDKIFKTYTDPAQASAAGLAFVRGTDWYARNFAGIGEGMKKGLFSDESGYRAYVNDANQIFQRFYGRNVTNGEIQDFLTKGTNPNAINAHLTGAAQVSANKGDIQYQLGAFDEQGPATDDELNQYGDTLGGLSNQVGPQLQARLDKARQRLAGVFQGTLSSPTMSLLNGKPIATSMGKDISNPDIAS